MQVRNARFNLDDSIDCEIFFNQQWLPYTATKDDAVAHGHQIYLTALASKPEAHIPKSEPVRVIPDFADKISLVRAMRTVSIKGKPLTDDRQSIWDLFKKGLETAPIDAKEDWEMFTLINRSDSSLDVLFSLIVSNEKQRIKIIDILFDLTQDQN